MTARGQVRHALLTTTAVVASTALAGAAILLPRFVLLGSDDGTESILSLEGAPDDSLGLNDRFPRRGDSGVVDGIAATDPSATPRPAVVFEPAPTASASAQPRPATISDLAASGIPQVALQAYRSAEATLAKADPSCRLDWSVLAGIGRVESDHGRFGGAVLRTDGRPDPEIIGIPLDGRPGVARISDSDGGVFDRDTTYDRAVGPMQFIPGTWDMVGADGNGDGLADPQNINDAALGSAIYLCSGSDDLSTRPGQEAAVFRYNRADSYVQLVLALANAYKAGLPVGQLPIGAPSATTPNVPTVPPVPAANPGPPGAVDFVEATPRPTPTASPRPTSSPTPKATTSPSPSPSPKPSTASPSPSPTPTPTPTPSPTPTPTPTPTKTPDPAPEKPAGLTVEQAVKGLELSWDKHAEDDVVRYEYRFAARKAPDDEAKNAETTGTKAVIKDLEPGTRYYAQVRAVDEAGSKSPWSTARSAVPTAAGDQLEPTAPTTVTSPAQTDTTLTIEWSGAADADADGRLIGYYVYLGTSRLTEEPVEDTTYKITGLEAKTEYVVTVVAVDAAFNESKPSDRKLFTTAAKADG